MSWLQSPYAVILEPKKMKSVTVSIVSPSICLEVMGPDAMIYGETMETVTDFISGGSKITADGDCSCEIKRRLLLGRKVMTNLDSTLKSRDTTLPTKVHLVKAMAPHSSTLAWKIPWMEEPGGLQSMRSLSVRHNRATSLSLFTFMHWRRKWQSTPVFVPGESHGWRSLVGCSPRGLKGSDTTERLHSLHSCNLCTGFMRTEWYLLDFFFCPGT